jgi:hypothetical protein
MDIADTVQFAGFAAPWYRSVARRCTDWETDDLVYTSPVRDSQSRKFRDKYSWGHVHACLFGNSFEKAAVDVQA